MSGDFFEDLLEGGGEVVDALAEGDVEGATAAAGETAEEAGENLVAAGQEAADAVGQGAQDTADAASEFVSVATGGAVNVSVGAGGAGASFDLGDDENGVHVATEVDLDFGDGSGGVRAEAGGAVLGTDAGTSAFAGVRTVGEGEDSQVGFDSGVGVSFDGHEAETGATVNVDTDTSGDGSTQTGVDVGFFGSVDGVRAETGGTVNIDEEADPDGGSQVGVDSGLFFEVGGHRVETGVTGNLDDDVDPDGTTQRSAEGGVFFEFDSHRTEAVTGVAGEVDDEGTVHGGVVAGVEADEHRAQVGVGFEVDPSFTDHGGGTSSGGADFGIGVFAEADGARADVQAEAGAEITNTIFRERGSFDTFGGVFGGGRVHAGVSAGAGDEEASLDVNLEAGGSELAESDATDDQFDLIAVEVEAEAGGHRAAVQVSANLDGVRDEDGNTTQANVDLGLAAEADDHLAEAAVTVGVSGLDTDEPTLDVGVAAEADGDRVEAGVFVRTQDTPNEVRFVDPITSVGVFAEANDDRVEIGTDDIAAALTEESSTLASAPEGTAATVEPPPSPVARRVQVVDALDDDSPTTEVDRGPNLPRPGRADDGPTPVSTAPRPSGSRIIEPRPDATDDGEDDDAGAHPTSKTSPAARVPRSVAGADDAPSREPNVERDEASTTEPARPRRAEKAVSKRAR